MLTGWIDSSSDTAVNGESAEGVRTIDAHNDIRGQRTREATSRPGKHPGRGSRGSLGTGCKELDSSIRKVVGGCQIYVCQVRKGKRIRILRQGS